MEAKKLTINSIYEPDIYQYTRSISFCADFIEDNKKQDFLKNLNLCDTVFDFSELLNFHRDLKKLIYRSDTNKPQIHKGLSIHKNWLKTWEKNIFHLYIKQQKKEKKYQLKDLIKFHYSHKSENSKKDQNSNQSIAFEAYLNQWEKLSQSLKEMLEAKEESQFRKSDISEKIKALLSNQGVFYFESFLKEIHSSDSILDGQIQKLKTDLTKIRDKLEALRKRYQISQAEGLEVAKASLNYYTVNKKPKEDYEKELEKVKQELGQDYFSFQKNSLKIEFFSTIRVISSGYDLTNNKRNSLFQFKSEQEKEWIERYCEKDLKQDLKKNDLGLSLNQTYALMKAFKSEQKSIFLEILKHFIQNKIFLDDNHSSKRNQNQSSSLLSDFTLNQNQKTKGLDYPINNKKLFLYGYKIDSNNFHSFEDFNEIFSLFKFKKLKKQDVRKLKGLPKKRYNKLYDQDIKGHYKNFIDLTKALNTEPKQNSDQKSKERGDWFFGKNCYFKNYQSFCKNYKDIAQRRGKLIAQIKGVEKEKRESLEVNYWALIYTESGKKQLWLVPKKHIQIAKQFIYNQFTDLEMTNSYLSSFESLTMRALHKLCFAEQSSFVTDLSVDLKKQHKKVKEFKTQNKDKDIEERNKNQKELQELQFFKELFQSEIVQKNLQIDNFNLTEVYKAKDKKAFEQALEEACYYEKKVFFNNEQQKQEFLKKFNVTVLNISSYDLKERNKNTYQSPKSKNRIHTDWWNEFWMQSKNNQKSSKTGREIRTIRLNPEIRIRYREMDENLKTYFDKRKFPKKFKHRKLKDQFTAHFTLSLNAGKKYEDLAFSEPEKVLEKIKDFNTILNKNMRFETAWKYGIDRGNIELATLCLAKFKPEDIYKVNGKNILKPTFPQPEKDIQCYSLKNYSLTKNYQTKTQGEKTRFAVKNISYFLEDEYLTNVDCFKQESLTCLDLTTAKVIKGKIITNGDIMTYLKLKKSVAKRRIFELYTKRAINSSSKLEWKNYEDGKTSSERSEGVLNIATNEGEKTIYWYCEKYEGILINSENSIKYNQKNIENSLNSYLESLKKSNNNEHTPSIQKINHLRDALVANMVGVICFLQKKYPGFIILEDLNKKSIDKHFLQHEENISRRLENALYNKFQTLGLVPPHVKDIIQLREDQNLDQIGAISFVSEENTSNTCPYCEEITKQDNDLKFKQHRFLCNKDTCGFDTYFFNKNDKEEPRPKIAETKKKAEFEIIKDIDDPDKVAAFNVAKKRMKNWQKK